MPRRALFDSFFFFCLALFIVTVAFALTVTIIVAAAFIVAATVAEHLVLIIHGDVLDEHPVAETEVSCESSGDEQEDCADDGVVNEEVDTVG